MSNIFIMKDVYIMSERRRYPKAAARKNVPIIANITQEMDDWLEELRELPDGSIVGRSQIVRDALERYLPVLQKHRDDQFAQE